MSMADLQWGLMMMVVGMGVVFALLLLLMLVLTFIGLLDARAGKEFSDLPLPEGAESSASAAGGPDGAGQLQPAVRIIADGLDENQVAAITIAVITHAETRRRKAAPETRAHAPGSQLFASRWLSVGRGFQNNPFTRR